MKAVTFKKFGGPEVLEIQDIEIGKPGQKEVLVKNLSIGLNFIDTYHRSGLYPIPLPSGIGLEACGVIEGFKSLRDLIWRLHIIFSVSRNTIRI